MVLFSLGMSLLCSQEPLLLRLTDILLSYKNAPKPAGGFLGQGFMPGV